MGFRNFVKYLFSPVPLDYKGPEAGWYVVPNYSQFTYSSVRGDFRLVPLAKGCFAAAWKDFVLVRDAGGRPLWRANDCGYTVAPSADGRQLLAYSANTQELIRFDTDTGRELARTPVPPVPPPAPGQDPSPGWVQQLIARPDGTVLVLMIAGVGVLAPDGRHWQAYHQGFMPAQEYPSMLGGMVWQPARPQQLLVMSDAAAVVLDLSTGTVLRQAPLPGVAVLPGPLGQQPLLYCYHPESYLLLDPDTLATTRHYPFEGLQGVRTQAEDQHQRSSTAWEKRALLSPGGKYLLAIDRSGLVWLFDATSGYKLRLFRRELLNHAYDVLWLNEQQFLALTNRGHVVKVDVTQLEAVFDVTDFSAADDARYLPAQDAAARRSAPSQAQVVAALDTLATTPDAAAYARAWDTIHYTPVGFDWGLHLTPARLAGAFRQTTWMLPAS
ncbi:MAG: hypothetical protein JWP58_1013, partial [Hymenobacter sp.]|nr:hypothetical protein [Hymenobacter sp.]